MLMEILNLSAENDKIDYFNTCFVKTICANYC